MYSYISGEVVSIRDDSCILDVNGIGYKIFCSAATLSQVNIGQRAKLLTHTHVREDALDLFGFLTELEQEWFYHLTDIKGVGNKVAQAIQTSLSPNEIYNAVLAQDKTAFKPITGIGPKLADRILSELKNNKKIGADITLPANSGDNIFSASPDNKIFNDAKTALSNLGYSQGDVMQTLQKIMADNDNISLEELIKSGLMELSRS